MLDDDDHVARHGIPLASAHIGNLVRQMRPVDLAKAALGDEARLLFGPEREILVIGDERLGGRCGGAAVRVMRRPLACGDRSCLEQSGAGGNPFARGSCRPGPGTSPYTPCVSRDIQLKSSIAH